MTRPPEALTDSLATTLALVVEADDGTGVTTDVLAEWRGVTEPCIREHLRTLRADGYVVSEYRVREYMRWRPTDLGRAARDVAPDAQARASWLARTRGRRLVLRGPSREVITLLARCERAGVVATTASVAVLLGWSNRVTSYRMHSLGSANRLFAGYVESRNGRRGVAGTWHLTEEGRAMAARLEEETKTCPTM